VGTWSVVLIRRRSGVLSPEATAWQSSSTRSDSSTKDAEKSKLFEYYHLQCTRKNGVSQQELLKPEQSMERGVVKKRQKNIYISL
jgi:hypothetical protein